MDKALVCFAVAAVSGTAMAGVYSPALVESNSDPSGWSFATSIASLDAAGQGYQFPANSGFAWYIAGNLIDQTEVVSEVFRIDQATVVGDGADSISLGVGDLVFAYRIRLVQAVPADTVTSLQELQIIGAPAFGFGQDLMPASFINGQGFVTPAHLNTPASANQTGADAFGSSIDFEWPGDDASNLDNDQFITLLMFSDPASIGQGVANMFAPPGQAAGLTGEVQAGDAPPVLIPIVPGPASAVLFAAGVGVAATRRRR